MLSTQKYFEMNRQMEYHYNNTGFPLESYIYLFEGPPYNYAELYAQESMYRSMSMHTGSNKFEPSSSGNTSYFGYVHAHEEDDRVPESVEEPEPSATHARENSNPTAPGSPEECIRSHSDASSSQVFWQDNIDVDNMTYEELLELGETVGTQSRGLSQELISSLPVSKYKSGGFFSRKKSHGDQCVICQMEYKRRDRQITLPCKHVYHAKCATRWLSINKACPVCYAEVFGKDSRH